MDNVENKTQSSLNISDEVVATIAKEALKDVQGISLLEDSLGRNVKISLANGVCQISISVIADENCRLKETCERLQEQIKSTIQNMTSITVSKVNVIVAGMAV